MKHQTYLWLISAVLLVLITGEAYPEESQDDALSRAKAADIQGHDLKKQNEVRQAIHSWKLAARLLNEDTQSHRILIAHLLVDLGIAHADIYHTDARLYLKQALKMAKEESLLDAYDARDLLYKLAYLDLQQQMVTKTTLQHALGSFDIASRPEITSPVMVINNMMQISSIYQVLGESENAYSWQLDVVKSLAELHETGEASSLILFNEYEKLLFMSLNLNDPELTERIFGLVQKHVTDNNITDPKTQISLSRMGSIVEFAWYMKTKNAQYLNGDRRQQYLQDAFDTFKENITSFPAKSFSDACDTAANLSQILDDRGKHAQSDQLMKEAIAYCIVSNKPRSTSVATRLLTLGQTRQRQGQKEAAYVLWRRASQIIMHEEAKALDKASVAALKVISESVQNIDQQLAASINDYLSQLEEPNQ